MVLIGVSFCLGVVTSTLTAWVWWKCGAWIAERLGLPSGIVEPGVLLFWLLPAVAIAFADGAGSARKSLKEALCSGF